MLNETSCGGMLIMMNYLNVAGKIREVGIVPTSPVILSIGLILQNRQEINVSPIHISDEIA